MRVIVPAFPLTELQVLLNNLAVGADKALFSVDDWSVQLGSDPTAQQFLDQMRREWQLITVPNEFCAAMMAFARNHLSAYTGWPHVWAHTLRVTGNALTLAAEANVEPEQAFLLAIFHDVGKLDELHYGVSHEEIGAQIVREQFASDLPPQLTNRIAEAIAKTARSSNAYTRLLHDSDKLDKIGATGLARRLSTNFGSQHRGLALRRVRSDAQTFPAMNHPTSDRLAALKKNFTAIFLASVDQLAPE